MAFPVGVGRETGAPSLNYRKMIKGHVLTSKLETVMLVPREQYCPQARSVKLWLDLLGPDKVLRVHATGCWYPLPVPGLPVTYPTSIYELKSGAAASQGGAGQRARRGCFLEVQGQSSEDLLWCGAK
jgi:hypothetical protein